MVQTCVHLWLHSWRIWWVPLALACWNNPLTNGIDLRGAEDIKKTWQEKPEELCKKDLHDPNIHDGIITHLASDILGCKIKWTLRGIATKLVEVMGSQLNYFQTLKDDVVKVQHSIHQQIWKTQQCPQDVKRAVSFQSQRKAMEKNVQTTA